MKYIKFTRQEILCKFLDKNISFKNFLILIEEIFNNANSIEFDETGKFISLEISSSLRIVELLINITSKTSTTELIKSNEEKEDLVFLFDKYYPKLLREISQPPLGLWVKGDHRSYMKFIHSDSPNLIAIVGTRKPQIVSNKEIKNLLDSFNQNTVIISGLAFGIDSYAHISAIAQRKMTVAVIPGGHPNISPRSHERLARNILNSDPSGLLIWELMSYQGDKLEKYHYIRRNRIIAGLASKTIIMESPEKSGTLITANIAFQENREVEVWLPFLENKNLSGNINLLRTNKASILKNNLQENLIIGVSESKDIKLALVKLANGDDSMLKKLPDYEIGRLLLHGTIQKNEYGKYKING